MASITKTASGYRVFIRIKGYPTETKSFTNEREANAWAKYRERELKQSQPLSHFTLLGALERYRDEVTPTKRGHHWEFLRINKMIREIPFVNLSLRDCQPKHFAEWRDARLRVVSGNSVIREFGILSAMFEVARKEWQLVQSNPLKDVRRPRAPDHRDIVISKPQIKAMLKSLGYSPTSRIDSVQKCVAASFLMALRTGMRSGEITKLTWDNVFSDYCFLPVTKTKKRNVPLSKKALRIIGKMRGFDSSRVFGLTPETRDAIFRKARDRAGLSGFTFHDSRHTAATWMANKVDVLTLCKIFGWTDTKQALTYFNPTASDIAKRL